MSQDEIDKKIYIFNRDNDYVEIHKQYHNKDELFEITGYGIIWSSIGNTTVKDTIKFIETLEKAIVVIEKIKLSK